MAESVTIHVRIGPVNGPNPVRTFRRVAEGVAAARAERPPQLAAESRIEVKKFDYGSTPI
jgi:hypothetical protein